MRPETVRGVISAPTSTASSSTAAPAIEDADTALELGAWSQGTARRHVSTVRLPMGLCVVKLKVRVRLRVRKTEPRNQADRRTSGWTAAVDFFRASSPLVCDCEEIPSATKSGRYWLLESLSSRAPNIASCHYRNPSDAQAIWHLASGTWHLAPGSSYHQNIDRLLGVRTLSPRIANGRINIATYFTLKRQTIINSANYTAQSASRHKATPFNSALLDSCTHIPRNQTPDPVQRRTCSFMLHLVLLRAPLCPFTGIGLFSYLSSTLLPTKNRH